MEPRSLAVEEYRIADLDLDIAVAHRIAGTHALADALPPACQHAEPDPVSKHGRERDRGHVAFVVLDRAGGADGNERRAAAQPLLAIGRSEADQRRTIRVEQGRALRHHAADI